MQSMSALIEILGPHTCNDRFELPRVGSPLSEELAMLTACELPFKCLSLVDRLMKNPANGQKRMSNPL
jgi:hypothetical protein